MGGIKSPHHDSRSFLPVTFDDRFLNGTSTQLNTFFAGDRKRIVRRAAKTIFYIILGTSRRNLIRVFNSIVQFGVKKSAANKIPHRDKSN